jgi:hypothetical protein
MSLIGNALGRGSSFRKSSFSALYERGSVFLQHDLFGDQIIDDAPHVARIGGAVWIQ